MYVVNTVTVHEHYYNQESGIKTVECEVENSKIDIYSDILGMSQKIAAMGIE